MSTLDWVVLVTFILFSLVWGLSKGRGSRTTRRYLLADKTMPWYAVALSIMATQASAITFLSTTGQAYADGMRFLQFYFGLPIAMVLLAIIAVPVFHRLDVYTAYQYLESRFDLKTRVLTSSIFLIQRGLAASLSLFAPALILSVVLGWDMRVTIWVIGVVVVIYTVFGGVLGVNWNDFQQFIVIMGGMLAALITTVLLLPADVSFSDAVSVAGAMGRLNAVDFSFDWQNRYNFWSGLIGGLFLALAYFGTDQSQVQRYLTARSVTQSRMGLLFNGMAKVPMQFFILFVGAMVFVFYQFVTPPLFFNPAEEAKIRSSPLADDYLQLEMQYQRMSDEKQASIRDYLRATRNGDGLEASAAQERLLVDYRRGEEVRRQAMELVAANDPRANTNDVNYVFLTFVTTFLPAGLVGLIIVIVFGATMTTTSSELNALATCTVIDVYQRMIRRKADERHYVRVSKIATALWGLFAIVVSERAARLGTLVEAVNILGSLFYGTVLGVFILAFFFRRVAGTAAFAAAILGEGVVLYLFFFTSVSFLWYNVFGSAAVVLIGLVLTALLPFNKQTIR
jgi:solute:Na+ symporter, SSS family